MRSLTFSDVCTKCLGPEATRRIRWRIGISASALFMGFLLSVAPIPYLTTDSITQETILLILGPSPCCYPPVKPAEWFAAYLFVATLVSLALSQPVHIYQGLALFGPLALAEQRRSRMLAALLLCAALLIGIVIAYFLVLPIVFTLLVNGLETILPGLKIRGTVPEYVVTAAGLTSVLGIGFQLALWPSVLARLGIGSLCTLRRFRRWVFLATVIVATLVTPSTDPLSMMLVAAPLYLFYEVGLLIAHWRLPLEPKPPTFPTRFQESAPLTEEFRWRGIVCLSALGTSFLVAIVPLPISLAQVVERVLTQPAAGHLLRFRFGESWSTLFVGWMLAVLFAHPVILRQLLDALTPAETPNRSWRLAMTTLAALVSCAAGVLVAYWLLLPWVIQSQLVFGLDRYANLWSYSEYVETTTRFMLGIGLASEIPAMMFGLVWLRIANRQPLASWRKYAVLVAAISAAWVTPTGDPFNLLVVALPMYLLFEVGLLIARPALFVDATSVNYPVAFRAILREARWRLGVCLASLIVAVLVTSVPLPFVADAALTDHIVNQLTTPVQGPGRVFSA